MYYKNYLLKVILFLGLVISVIWFVSCVENSSKKITFDKMENTKWFIEIAEGCISELNFLSDKKYLEYNCEMEDSLKGCYGIENGYIYLYQEENISEESILIDSSERIGKVKFKLVIEGNKLRYLTREDFIDGEWVKSNHTFSEDYFYLKKN
jgi:hypothetical protein